jgi:hypothetical protein
LTTPTLTPTTTTMLSLLFSPANTSTTTPILTLTTRMLHLLWPHFLPPLLRVLLSSRSLPKFGAPSPSIATFRWITVTTSTTAFSNFNNSATPFATSPEPFINVRTDIHLWERNLPEFEKNFAIGLDVLPATRASIIAIIESHWDCFYGAGVKFPISFFEFAIDTGASPPCLLQEAALRTARESNYHGASRSLKG